MMSKLKLAILEGRLHCPVRGDVDVERRLTCPSMYDIDPGGPYPVVRCRPPRSAADVSAYVPFI